MEIKRLKYKIKYTHFDISFSFLLCFAAPSDLVCHHEDEIETFKNTTFRRFFIANYGTNKRDDNGVKSNYWPKSQSPPFFPATLWHFLFILFIILFALLTNSDVAWTACHNYNINARPTWVKSQAGTWSWTSSCCRICTRGSIKCHCRGRNEKSNGTFQMEVSRVTWCMMWQWPFYRAVPWDTNI